MQVGSRLTGRSVGKSHSRKEQITIRREPIDSERQRTKLSPLQSGSVESFTAQRSDPARDHRFSQLNEPAHELHSPESRAVLPAEDCGPARKMTFSVRKMPSIVRISDFPA